MAEAQIPTDKGMLVTGHRDVKSYNQYNANLHKLQMDTCQRIISGDGKKYAEVLSQEVKKGSGIKVNIYLQFCSSLCFSLCFTASLIWIYNSISNCSF